MHLYKMRLGQKTTAMLVHTLRYSMVEEIFISECISNQSIPPIQTQINEKKNISIFDFQSILPSEN